MSGCPIEARGWREIGMAYDEVYNVAAVVVLTLLLMTTMVVMML